MMVKILLIKRTKKFNIDLRATNSALMINL